MRLTLAILLIAFSLGSAASLADDISLYPTYSSIGIEVKAKLEPKVEYRKVGTVPWLQGHRMTALPGGRWVGSLLLLESGTEYEIEIPVTQSESRPRISTWPEKPPGPRKDPEHSAVTPKGGIEKAFSRARPGDIVLLGEEDYYESIDVSVSGTPDKPIWIRSAGKHSRILGCREDLNRAGSNKWAKLPGEVFSVALDHPTGFVAANGVRLYHYASLDEVKKLIHLYKNADEFKLGGGWFQDKKNSLYVHLEKGADPNRIPMQVAQHNNGFRIHGRSNIVIDGIELAYFGSGQYGSAIDIKNSQNIVVQNCRIHHVRTGVSARGMKTERVTVQDSKFWDSRIDEWPWRCVKAHDVEGSAVSFSGGRGLVARRNDISVFFNGVVASMWGNLEDERFNRDIDVYENVFYRITDDPMEPEGACINNRYFLNTTVNTLQGISLAPITRGPTYVFCNLFADFNGGAFKAAVNSRGEVFCYNNTCRTDREKQNGMESSGKWDNMHFRNNIIMATRYVIEDYYPGKKKATWDYDCFYSPQTPLIKWENKRYKTLADWTKATGHEKYGISAHPKFADVDGPKKGIRALFQLKASSPCVGAGLEIPGLNYPVGPKGRCMGCFEFGTDFGPPEPKK